MKKIEKRIKIVLPRTDRNVNLLERLLGNIDGNSTTCTQFVGSIKNYNCFNRQQISYSFLPDQSFSNVPVERIHLCLLI